MNRKGDSSQPYRVKMATVMKELMDLFYEESIRYQDLDDYDSKFVFDAAVSLANNCHQKSPDEIRIFLTDTFTEKIQRVELTSQEKLAWQDALLIVELYFS